MNKLVSKDYLANIDISDYNPYQSIFLLIYGINISFFDVFVIDLSQSHKNQRIMLPIFASFILFSNISHYFVTIPSIASFLQTGKQDISDQFQLLLVKLKYNNVQLLMKRVGLIYNRDTSKSKDKVTKLPLKDIDINANRMERGQQRQNKKWRMELDNVQDSEQQRNYIQFSKNTYESDRREVTFSEPRFEERSVNQEGEEDVVKKLACLTKIINEIGTLKACGLKQNQQEKLMEIQDRLFEYERKVLQNEKLNYI